jgi:hypothetical protein
VVAFVDGDPWHPQWLPQRKGSVAFRQAASPGDRRGFGSGATQDTVRFHLFYLFERVEIEEVFGLLREWRLAQIADQNKDFDQLICDGKILRDSVAQVDGADGATRIVTKVTLYARELGEANAQTSFGTGESHEREALKVLLRRLKLDGVLIQADALHTSPAFFNSPPSRAPTCS